jgi:hypothetical protein
MIQRIQSLYLFVVAFACGLLFFFPMIDYTNVAGTYKLYATGLKYFGDITTTAFHLPLFALIMASMILALATIFFFKNRRVQGLLVSINLLLNVALVAVVFLVYSRIFEKQLNTLSSYQFGMYIPLISLVFLVMASRAIRKDEAMVKSTDRLR